MMLWFKMQQAQILVERAGCKTGQTDTHAAPRRQTWPPFPSHPQLTEPRPAIAREPAGGSRPQPRACARRRAAAARPSAARGRCRAPARASRGRCPLGAAPGSRWRRRRRRQRGPRQRRAGAAGSGAAPGTGSWRRWRISSSWPGTALGPLSAPSGGGAAGAGWGLPARGVRGASGGGGGRSGSLLRVGCEGPGPAAPLARPGHTFCCSPAVPRPAPAGEGPGLRRGLGPALLTLPGAHPRGKHRFASRLQRQGALPFSPTCLSRLVDTCVSCQVHTHAPILGVLLVTISYASVRNT